MAEQMMQHKAGEMAAKQTIPAGYKQTEVGIIPSDWGVKCLGELVEISSGESPSKFTFNSSGTPYFKVEQLNNGLVYAESTPYFIDTRKKITSGSLIFPKRGASILLNKIRVLKYDSYMDTNLMTLTCSSELNEFYLYNQLVYKELSSVADTTSIPQINNKHIVPYSIPYPAKAEQIAIATALSDSDALIVGLEQLIAKKQAIKTATMQQLLTGRTRLPQFALRPDGTPKGYKSSELGQIPEDWVHCALNEVATFGGGTTPPRQFYEKYFVSGSHPWVKTLDLNNGYIWETDEFVTDAALTDTSLKKYAAGSVLVAMYGGFNQIGRTGLIKVDAAINQALVSISPEKGKLNAEYLLFNLNFNVDYWKGVASSSRKDPNITNNDVKQYRIPIPQLAEQTAIATILSDMDSELTALEQKLAKARDLKQGMMQQLLTGRIRLPLPKEE